MNNYGKLWLFWKCVFYYYIEDGTHITIIAKMNHHLVKILGINIERIKKNEAIKRVSDFLDSDRQSMIFTPNPEMLVDAQRDKYFKEVLNKGVLNLCDGFGLQLFSGFRLKRISGVDFMQDILKLAEQKNKSVYFLGSGSEKVISNLKRVIREEYPKLKIVGAHPGHELRIMNDELRGALDLNKQMNDDLLAEITMSEPDILFVAFGHEKQEKWIYEYIADMPSVKIAMGVGGSFDFLSGKIKRAPKFIRTIGMEWLYRLILELKRIKRIFKATFVFMCYAIFKKK